MLSSLMTLEGRPCFKRWMFESFSIPLLNFLTSSASYSYLLWGKVGLHGYPSFEESYIWRTCTTNLLTITCNDKIYIQCQKMTKGWLIWFVGVWGKASWASTWLCNTWDDPLLINHIIFALSSKVLYLRSF